jgi:nitroimidazol reductase NimA-like FMN-containing flavoprotein (pyridoxamine 5'-phosphate oxidase superfamily)
MSDPPVVVGWATDDDALADFLSEPNLCRIATVDPSRYAHVVPVWFWWDGERFWIGADAADRKVANVRRTKRATIEIDSDLRRRRGIFARGAARVLQGEVGRSEYLRISAEQVRRYRPDQPAAETAERMASKGTPVVIEVTPTSIVSWGR